jgi:hypothetical protein
VSVAFSVNFSELHHGQAGDSPEIAKIQHRNVKAKMQRRSTNQQILERKLNAHRLLLTFDAPGQARNIKRYTMHRDIICQSLDEFQPALLLSFRLGAIGPMNQLSDSHHR